MTADAWLSRGLLYFLLGGYLFIVYVAVLALGGVNNETSPPWWLNAISLPVLVLTVRPVHAWLRGGVHRVVYGQLDDPYALITEIHERVGADPSVTAMVPAIADAIARSLKLPFVAIDTLADPGQTVALGDPVDGAETLTVALAYHGMPVGTLRASARRAGEAFSMGDVKLLHDLAHQVGMTLYAAQLTAALQASRQQIVMAREEERRRIRRDLHDGLGPTLASMRMQLGALRGSLRSDPDGAEALIDSLRGDVIAATADIRRLVYDLRPPMLDEFGLAGALRTLGGSGGSAGRTVDLPEHMPPLSAATEVALYRIAAEAMHNSDRHAEAHECTVQLRVTDDAVTLTVTDDGAGIMVDALEGVGMTSIRERAAELGGTVTWTTGQHGGTVVRAVLPR